MENRVENELDEWLTRERRFQKLFSFSLDNNRAFLREKLRYYRTLQAKYRARAGPKEQLTLRMMRQEQRAIEKQLYPNLWVRLGYKVLLDIIGTSSGKEQKRYTANIRDLQESFRKLGFPDIPLDKQQLADRQKMTVPVSYEVGENKRMAFELQLKQGDKGQFYLEGYTAALHETGAGSGVKKQYFQVDRENNINTRQAYNLLSGRPVVQGNGENRHWMQLDFNDRDPHGNYRVKRFYPGYGFDLEKKLRELPLKELRTPEERRKLIKALHNGEQKEVTLIQGYKQQRIILEANPRFKSLNLYNGKGEKISLAQALNGKISKRTRLKKGKRLGKGRPGKDRFLVKRR
ncbi:hypothetical protein ED312_08425 [Sinomicrobium pectinilyticum]|uniref:Uncharacterized protein n=2 Tax=Sinomicrobium pectinilyticum TaxID=1084421 RepID=A0A3N0EKP6_SINP1|nr:hypothetical protein ED312_08425 [Sinomicrobium pectinilyticum]